MAPHNETAIMAQSVRDSAKPPVWRIIHDPPASGTWNMAVDEMMLERVTSNDQPVLRFYSWNEATLSLGYFQNLTDRQLHQSSLGCPVVRRSTGGGAIVHDREVTYSVATPLADRWSARATDLYDQFHVGFIRALAHFGVVAQLCEATTHQLTEPFLCFERRAKGDVLISVEGCGTYKIVGSAQRRRQGALVQHGSIVLQQSKAAPEIVGLFELAENCIPVNDLLSRWVDEILRNSGSSHPGQWSAEEVEHARRIEEARFASDGWLARRTSV